MGQKTNPNIFQINKTQKWNSIYIEKKSREHYLYNSRDLEIKKFIIKFFKDKGLIVQNCKLSYLNNSLNIFISFYQQKITTLKLIKRINKLEKIRLKKLKTKNFFNKKKPKILKKKILKKILKKKRKKKLKKKKLKLIQKIKNYYEYEKLNYKKVCTKINKLKNKKKVKRLQFIQFHKKCLNLKKNGNIKNEASKRFLNSLFQALNLFYNKKLLLTIVLKPLNIFVKKNLNKRIQKKLKRRLIGLKKYQNNAFFKDGVDLIFASVRSKNSAELISKYIALTLKKLKKHNFFFKFLDSLLKIFISKTKIVKGIKIKIKGRLNRSRRARHKILDIGKSMSLITIDSSIKYAESTAYTSNGTISVKIWICEKKE